MTTIKAMAHGAKGHEDESPNFAAQVRVADPCDVSPIEGSPLVSAIIDVIDALVVVLDTEGRIVSFNRACESATGYSFVEVRHQPVWNLLVPEEVNSFKAVFHQLRSGSYPNQHQNYWVAKDGGRRWIAWWNTALLGPDGKVEYVIGTGIDETSNRALQHECDQCREQLAHALRIGSLEAIASGFFHEIGQPLWAVSNYLAASRNMLQAGIAAEEPERVSGVLEEAQEQADRTIRIVNGLKRLVRSRSPERTMFHLNQAVQNVVSLLASYARDSHITVVVELGDEVPQVEGDPIQFEQVILNLMCNAIEAMSDGDHAERQLTVRTMLGQDGQVDVTVADTGPGMTDQIAQRVFDPYFTTKTGGFGLGLSMSKAIIEAHGGRLKLEEYESKGTTFRVTMPAA